MMPKVRRSRGQCAKSSNECVSNAHLFPPTEAFAATCEMFLATNTRASELMECGSALLAITGRKGSNNTRAQEPRRAEANPCRIRTQTRDNRHDSCVRDALLTREHKDSPRLKINHPVHERRETQPTEPPVSNKQTLANTELVSLQSRLNSTCL